MYHAQSSRLQLTVNRARNSVNQLLTERSSTVYTNVFSVLVVQLHVHHIGGTVSNILDQLFFFNLSDGSTILVMRERLNERKPSRTACHSTDVTPFSTVRELVQRVWTQQRLLLRSRRQWQAMLDRIFPSVCCSFVFQKSNEVCVDISMWWFGVGLARTLSLSSCHFSMPFIVSSRLHPSSTLLLQGFVRFRRHLYLKCRASISSNIFHINDRNNSFPFPHPSKFYTNDDLPYLV